MAFAGLANAKDRADVIAYLKSNAAWATLSPQGILWEMKNTQFDWTYVWNSLRLL